MGDRPLRTCKDLHGCTLTIFQSSSNYTDLECTTTVYNLVEHMNDVGTV